MKVLAVFLAASLLLPVHAAAQLRADIVATGLSQPVAFVPDPVLNACGAGNPSGEVVVTVL